MLQINFAFDKVCHHSFLTKRSWHDDLLQDKLFQNIESYLTNETFRIRLEKNQYQNSSPKVREVRSNKDAKLWPSIHK